MWSPGHLGVISGCDSKNQKIKKANFYLQGVSFSWQWGEGSSICWIWRLISPWETLEGGAFIFMCCHIQNTWPVKEPRRIRSQQWKGQHNCLLLLENSHIQIPSASGPHTGCTRESSELGCVTQCDYIVLGMCTFLSTTWKGCKPRLGQFLANC